MNKTSGIKINKNKNTTLLASERITAPQLIYVSMLQHIGEPATPIVKEKDKVKIGQLIAKASYGKSSPIHSGISGTVKKITEMQHQDGSMAKTIVIESDGEKSFADFKPVEINSYNDFIKAVSDSGTVGLGGAGYPSWIKLSHKNLEQIDTIIINAAECEPYITSDTRALIEKNDMLYKGIYLLKKFLNIKNIFIAVENTNEEALRVLGSMDSEVTVYSLPPIYPQGSEKTLVYNILGRTIPEGKYPPDVGVIVINSTSLISISEYIYTGKPLYERIITVDGSAIKDRKNVIVPIGTPISDIINFCGCKAKPRKILLGGPMMGYAAADYEIPIQKRNNSLLVLDEKDSLIKKTTACIRCGKCVSVCPVFLDPVAIAAAYENRSPDALKKAKPNLCIECGCCSYICPTGQPLVQRNKLAKALVKDSNR